MADNSSDRIVIDIAVKSPDSRDCAFKIYSDPAVESDQRIRESIEGGALYESEISALFASVLREGDTVLDVGANVGWFTLLSAAMVGPSGRVIALEPAPGNILKLRDNVSLNKLTNVDIRETAVSDSMDDSILYLNPHGNGGHALWDMQEGKAIPVTTMTLDSLMLNKVRLVKIDTEGHEVRVLAGAHKLLSEVRPAYVVAELHEPGLHAFGDSQASLRKMMTAHGYDTYLFLRGFPIPVFLPPDTAVKTNYTQNFLFTTPTMLAELCPEVIL